MRQALLDAALALLTQRGYRALTMEGIAASAGVGKQTLYRRWPSKAIVVLTALAEHADRDIPLPDTGDGCTDVARMFATTFSALRGTDGPVLRVLMAEAQLDEGFAMLFRQQLIDGRRAALGSLLARAQLRGELDSDADVDFLVDLAYGAMWYRLLLGYGTLSKAAATAVARAVFAAGRRRRPRSSRRQVRS